MRKILSLALLLFVSPAFAGGLGSPYNASTKTDSLILPGSTGVLVGNGSSPVTTLSTTGSGSVVLGTSPTLTTPALGTPSALTLTNATGLPWSTGITSKPTTLGGYGITDAAALNSSPSFTGSITMAGSRFVTGQDASAGAGAGWFFLKNNAGSEPSNIAYGYQANASGVIQQHTFAVNGSGVFGITASAVSTGLPIYSGDINANVTSAGATRAVTIWNNSTTTSTQATVSVGTGTSNAIAQMFVRQDSTSAASAHMSIGLGITGGLQVDSTLALNQGLQVASYVPSSTSGVLYNNSGTLFWNGNALATGSSVSGTTGYVPTFTASNALGNSVIRTSSSGVGINASPGSFGLALLGPSSGTATGTLALLTPSSASAETSGLALYGTFGTGSDHGTRRVADIWAGMTVGWDTGYLAFGVGNGGTSNDGQVLTTKLASLSAGGWNLLSGSYLKNGVKVTPSINLKADFGAACDGTTDDTTAFNNAISAANSASLPILIGPGNCKVTAATTTITASGVKLKGFGIGATTITIACGCTPFTWKSTTSGTKIFGVGAENLKVSAYGQTSGYVFAVDYASNVTFKDVFIDTPYQLLSVRQATNVLLQNVDAENITGGSGVYAYGDGTTRNGETDRTDVINFVSTVLTAKNSTGTPQTGWTFIPSQTTNLVVLDGFVQSMQYHKLQLLRGNHAIWTINSPGLSVGSYAFGVTGSDLEAEFCYAECIRAEWLNYWVGVNLYAWGSYNASTAYFGSHASEIKIHGGKVGAGRVNGITFDGASDITLTGLDVVDNSQSADGAGSDIVLGGGQVTNFLMVGGTMGKLTAIGSQHKTTYNISVSSATGVVKTVGVAFGNYVTAATGGSITNQ